jgi:hypothetical protein
MGEDSTLSGVNCQAFLDVPLNDGALATGVSALSQLPG